jgi:hypothetical protein
MHFLLSLKLEIFVDCFGGNCQSFLSESPISGIIHSFFILLPNVDTEMATLKPGEEGIISEHGFYRARVELRY